MFRLFDCRTLAAASVLALASVQGGAFAQAQPQAQAEKIEVEGVGTIDAVKMSASVLAVDVKNRTVTLKGPRGNIVTLPVSEDVRNLPQVKAGDIVDVVAFDAIAIDARRDDKAKPSVTEQVAQERAKEGGQPAAVRVRKVHVVTTVLGTNKENQSVIVKGPTGLTEVKLRDPKVFAAFQKGNGQINMTYIEGVAIGVRSASVGSQ